MEFVRIIKYNFSIPCTMKHTTETSIVTGTLYKVKFKVNGNLETAGSKIAVTICSEHKFQFHMCCLQDQNDHGNWRLPEI